MLKWLRAARDRSVNKLYHWLAETEMREGEKLVRDIMARCKFCGADVIMRGPLRLSGAEQMEVGQNVFIGENAFIRAEGGLKIGDNTVISRNLVLYTVNHRYDGERLPYDQGSVRKPVTIGRNVWIGMNVCIAPGTVIGDGAIIGLGTTVSGEVPPRCIIGSQKWRVLGQRDEDAYRHLDEAGAYSDPFGKPFLSSGTITPNPAEEAG